LEIDRHGYEQRMGGRDLGWVLAGAALAAATLVRVLGIDGRSTAYVAGAALGSIAAGVLLALLVRFAYVRLVRHGRPLWSPWVLVIAAVVTLVVAVTRAVDTARQRAQAADECASPARTAAQLVAGLPDGWRSAPASDEVIDQFSRALSQTRTRRLTARSIMNGAQPVAAVVVIEMHEPADPDELFAGFTEGAGGDVEDARLGHAPAKLYRAPDGGATLVGLSDRCAGAVVLGVSPRAARRLAAALPVDAS
jgi:hypothetical protein